MYKWVGCMLLICLFILSGCMNSAAYKDEDVAAIVRGEEITIGYLRVLYPDDAIVEMIDEPIKAKLAEQEGKKRNIDVSKQVKEIEESYGKYPHDELHSTEAQSIRAFADPQTEELGTDPKHNKKKYTATSDEMMAYITAYNPEKLGELEDDELDIEENNRHAHEVFEVLVEEHKNAIDIRIK